MSYLVTARKWRPQFFRDVIGQEHVTATLRNAIISGQVGHAYLFSGPRGVGKTTVARIFAKALNCIEGPAEEPCNTCEICTSIQSGSAIDIQELDAASHNSVDDIRDLISRVGYHAARCRYKIYIVDEVHMLSTAAFNALLKTLEEPPANVVFVFATTDPQKLPPTILSRCQRYDFRRLSVSDIARKLQLITTAENIAIDDASLMLIARRATGAMRDAESILEQLKASRGTAITTDDVTEILGIADRAIFFDLMDRCHDRDTSGAIALFNAYYDGGGDLREFVEGLLGHLRDILYAGFPNGIDQLPLPNDLRERLITQTSWYRTPDVVRMIGYVTETESSLAHAIMPLLRIEVTLARMAALETTMQLDDLVQRLGGASTGIAHSGTATRPSEEHPDRSLRVTGHHAEAQSPPTSAIAQPSDAAPDAQPIIGADLAAIAGNWIVVTDAVGAVTPSAGASLGQSTPVDFERGVLTLQFPASGSFHQKTVERNAAAIAGIITGLIGSTVSIKCVTAPGAMADQKPRTELDDLIKREPIIGTVIDRFGGDIKDMGRN